jgi:hypothetical protein
MDTLDAIEQESKSVPYTGLSFQWGFIGGLANIVLLVSLFLANRQYESGFQSLGMIIMFVCCFFCVKSVREAHPHRLITFGNGFTASFLCGIVISLIGIFFFPIYVNYIDTNYYEQLPVIAKAKLQERGLSELQVSKVLEMRRKFMTPGLTLVFALALNIFMTMVISLISAGILKRSAITD